MVFFTTFLSQLFLANGESFITLLVVDIWTKRQICNNIEFNKHVSLAIEYLSLRNYYYQTRC